MGIHNSSILSTERRVVNHNTFKPNMKAFMTACAVLASSANADPQRIANLVNLDQTVSHPGLIPMIRPYNVVPLNQVRYTNAFNYGMTHPLSTYGLASVPAYSMETLPAHTFKREAEPSSVNAAPYEIKTKIDNPLDGSKQEVQIKVDSSGKGKSFLLVEQKGQREVASDNYILEHRRMAQRPLISKMYMAAQRGMDRNHQMEGLNQMRLDRNQMDRNRMEAYRNQQQRLEDQMMIQRNHDTILVENMGQRNDQLHHQMAGRPRQTDNTQQLGMTQMKHMEAYRNQQQRLEDQMVLQRNHDAMLVENMGRRNDMLHHQMAGRPRQMDNTQQLGMTQMVQLMNHNLKNAVESHSETGKNMMNALESHEELGQNLRDAIQLYESTPETMGSRRYSNMRDAMVLNNNRNNMREGTMIHPQNQMIHTQEMRI